MTSLEKSISLKEALDTLRPLSPDDEKRVMDKFRLDWNYHSNHLEGNSLTYGETKALILFGITAQGKPLRDHFEITGHDEAVKWVLDVIKEERPLTENFIRELHEVILKEPYEKNAITPEGAAVKRTIHVGVYKTTPNHVLTATGEIFRFASPEETPAKMKDLLDWYRSEASEEEVNPILLAATFHYRFVRIHPFDDGNGRTARILMNFILLKFGYPPVIIKTEDKENYFAVLRLADAGELEPFVTYLADNLSRSLEIMIKGAKGESVEEPDDIDKKVALLKQRLDSVGEEVTVLKNEEILREISVRILHPLIDRFLKKGKLFDQFYLETKSFVSINGRWEPKLDSNIPLFLENKLNNATNIIEIKIKYNHLKQFAKRKYSYLNELSFSFSKSYFSIHNSDQSIRIAYSEDFGTKQIEKFVDFELDKHSRFLEEVIEKERKI